MLVMHVTVPGCVLVMHVTFPGVMAVMHAVCTPPCSPDVQSHGNCLHPSRCTAGQIRFGLLFLTASIAPG